MPRTLVSRSTVARNAVVRNNLPALRLPYWIYDLGLLWAVDVRTGKQGLNTRVIADLVGGRDLAYRGTTAIGSIYTNGQYQVDLEETAGDAFLSNPAKLAAGTMANFSVVICLKRENVNTSDFVLSMWKATGTQRMFQIKLFNNANNNAISFLYTHNGSTNAERRTDINTKVDNQNFHVIECVFNPNAAADIYLDGVAAGTTQILGSTQPVIFNSLVEICYGGTLDAAGALVNTFDGKVGFAAMFNQSHNSDQAAALSDYLTKNYSF